MPRFLRPTLALLVLALCASLFPASSWAAYSVSIDAPALLSYGSLQTSPAQQTIFVNGGVFSVTDTRMSAAGYYATLSISNLTSSASATIGRANVALYVTGATVSTLSGSANPAVVVPTGAGAIGTQYVSLASAVTLISRDGGGGISGKYGVSPVFRLTVPAYSPAGSYSATITVTLIENAGACDPNYTWNGSSCIANTQTVSCGGSIATNATASSASTYTQTWNSSAWAPTASWAYAASAGTCTYACNGGYSWNGSACAVTAVAANARYDVLSMHMNGAASTTVTSAWADHGNNGKIVTTVGDAKVSTAQSKFGGGSLRLDGAGDSLYLADSEDWDFGTESFTVELFASFSSITNTDLIWRHNQGVSSGYRLNYDGTNLSWRFGSSDVVITTTAWTPSLNTWYHFAVARSAWTTRIFVNGSVLASWADTNTYVHSNALAIGSTVNATPLSVLDGYIDEVRITKWVARYTANFTAPSARFGDTMSEDAYYASTVLLLHMDGTNGSTAFMDSGNNGRVVTATGDAKVSTAQSKFGGASAYFDGSGDYLSSPANVTAFSPGTGDITIDGWFYLTNVGAGVTNLFGIDNGAWSNQKILGYVDSGGAIHFDITQAGWASQATSSASTIANNTWYHIAFVRYSGVASIFVNGIRVASWAATGNLDNLVNPFYVGYLGESYGVTMLGYIDDFRVTKWVARYTANFTPPTGEFSDSAASDPYYAFTVLSLHMNGANGSTFFPDSGNNGKSMTAMGDAKVSTAQSKFWGASAYFDGSGDYLSIPNSADFGFGTENFTIEFWVYSSDFSPDKGIIHRSVGNNQWWFIDTVSNWVRFLIGNGSTWVNSVNSTANLVNNQWNHVAIVRNGTTFTYYINGVNSGGYTSSSVADGSTGLTKIGGGWSYSSSYDFSGYIDDIRITKWAARYTANFTPPTGALPDSTASDPYYANTVLLLHMDGAQATTYGTNFMDTANNGKVVTAMGDAKVSTTQSKFGGGSLLLNGSGSYLSIPDSDDFYLRSENFTIEAWIYPTTFANYPTIAAQNQAGVYTNSSFFLDLESANGIGLYLYSGNAVTTIVANNVLSLNQWQHVAAVRNGTTASIYVNGALVATSSIATALNNSTMPIVVGGHQSGSFSFGGQIDDVRVTKWVARYTANFTPSTSAFGNTSSTDTYFANNILLLHADGGNNSTFFPDSANNGKSVTTTGDAKISTAQSKFGGASAYFDGAGDTLYLNPGDNSFLLKSGDFTVETWVKLNSLGTQQFLIDKWAGGASWDLLVNTSNKVVAEVYNGSTYGITSATALAANTWYHVAYVRSGNTLSLYINGTLEGSLAFSGAVSDGLQQMYLGSYNSANYLNGYLDDVRVTKWVARYTANFTPPTAALPDTFATDPYFAQTILLLHGDGTNASTFFPDSANNGKIVTAYGDAKMTNAQGKFWGTSAYFDGAGDYISFSSTADWTLPGDFTIEAYVYRSGSWHFPVVSTRVNSTWNQYLFWVLSTGELRWHTYNETLFDGGSVSASTWTHIAVSRYGTTTRFFVGWSLVWSIANDTRAYSDLSGLKIWQDFSIGDANGYIDDLRITKWLARYTANFTPPTAEFADE